MKQIKVIRNGEVTNILPYNTEAEIAHFEKHVGMGSFGEEFTTEVEDLTDKLEQERINREALQYLAETDWYFIRLMDSRTLVPQEIIEARAAARARIIR